MVITSFALAVTIRAVDLASHDVATLERMARRRRRTWLAAIVGNAMLVVVLVGGPWLRGRHRAMEAREAFGELAACLFFAEPDPQRGLTLPAGDMAVYADASRVRGWPEVCVHDMRFDREPAFWLFPEVRVAEADVVRASRVVVEELEAATDGATVPSRPRLALLRLSAAIAVYAQAADAYVGLDAPAIILPEARSVMPERVPVQAAEDSSLEVYAHADGIEMVAMDSRGLSWVRVRGGRHDGRRLRRPMTLRGTARERNASHLLWWTDPERCAPDCSRRAMGWARLNDDVTITPEPRWFAAHPVADDAHAIESGTLSVVALASPEPELRRFDLATPAEEVEEGEAAPPTPPTERVALPGAHHPHVSSDAVWWTHEGSLWEHRNGETRSRGPGAGWVRRVGDWVWVESGELLHDGEPVATMQTSDDVKLVANGRAWLFARRDTRLEVAICDGVRPLVGGHRRGRAMGRDPGGRSSERGVQRDRRSGDPGTRRRRSSGRSAAPRAVLRHGRADR